MSATPRKEYALPEMYSFPPLFTCVALRFPRYLRRVGRACAVESRASFDILHALVGCGLLLRSRLQPVDVTRERQLAVWRDIIVGWHRARDVSLMTVSEWPLWENAAISSACGVPNVGWWCGLRVCLI